jgi:hypothetical protein
VKKKDMMDMAAMMEYAYRSVFYPEKGRIENEEVLSGYKTLLPAKSSTGNER